MNRFFVEKSDIVGNTARLYGEDVKHIQRVLRLGVGDAVTLCDGEGLDYPARITDTAPDCVSFSVDAARPSAGEAQCAVTLFQGLPKAGKLELIIQKCVELGVAEVAPVSLSRSVVRVDKKEFSGRLSRFQRVALEAAKQCRRGRIPKVSELLDCRELAARLAGFDIALLAYEEEHTNTLKCALRGTDKPKSIALIIGPEGGIAPEEVDILLGAGAIAVTLGERILRTETAGMAALAMILYELEG